VEGNLIGTDKAGATGLGNTTGGVAVVTGASHNTIGGTLAGAGNTIADTSSGPGVVVGGATNDTSTVGNSVLGNTITGNGGTNGLGIDQGDNGPTVNGSGPGGPNHFQSYPVLTTPLLNGDHSISLTFTFLSLPSSTFRLEFFLNNAGTTAQGQTFLGTVNVTTDSAGAVTRVTGGSVTGDVASVTLAPPTGVTPVAGQLLTATATLLTTSVTTGTPGDTSEFSAPGATLQGK
jgi:hypothetical protein